MNINIIDRKCAESLSSTGFAPNTALISICDTGATPPNLRHDPAWMLRLVFDDISSDEIDEYKGQKYTLFDESMARKTAEFVFKHKDEVETLICQCEYGQSRSAAIAAAVTEYFCGNGIEIFADDRYYPNKLVFRSTLQALRVIGDREI